MFIIFFINIFIDIFMNLLFLIGIEGSGHHLFHNICNWREKGRLHNLINNYFSNEITIERKNELKVTIRNYIKKHPNINHFELASFPYKRPINSLRRYDIKEFYDLFKSIDNVNLFFIVTTRNIIHSTLSAYDRFDKKISPIIEGKLQEDSLIYINSQIQLLPKESYMVVDYNNICEKTEDFEKEFILRSCFEGIKFDSEKVRKSNKIYENHKYYKYFYEFFDEKRMKQFEFINSKIINF